MLKKSSFFNFWYFGLLSGLLLAVTVIAYIVYKVSWGFGFGIVTVAMAIATVVFLYGTPFYRHKLPGGSPITSIAQVVVAAIRKRNISMPSDVSLLYEDRDVESIKSESIKPGQRHLSHTDNFQFLDKAAIMVQNSSEWNTDTQGSAKPNPWKVCTVTQVEETKLILRMVPIWFSSLTFGLAAVSQNATFFIRQGHTMDRSMGSHFKIPAVSLGVFSTIFGLAFVIIYDRCMVPLARRITGNERGITVLQRIGIGLFFSLLCMVIAALTEKKRIHAAETHGLLDSPTTTIPMSAFWLVPQFVLAGIADVFTLVGLQEYFYNEAPDSMRSLGIAFYVSVLGVASFLNGLVITLVESMSKRGGHEGWLVNNLNRCKLEYFYWLLAIFSAINLCCYVFIANIYNYKKVNRT
uniref:Major facilitator superfamily (MFS) profile domain-containing protein n=1 Tax=Picea sitchensis TaxID=3332 RepID=B8LQ68_PICSI|nr:unknown [Picea sitchensis]